MVNYDFNYYLDYNFMSIFNYYHL